MTPAERLVQAEELRSAFPDPQVPGRVRSTDESPDLWLRMLAHLGHLGTARE